MDAEQIKKVIFFNGRISGLLKQLDDINHDLDMISSTDPLGDGIALSPGYYNSRTVSLDRQDKLLVVQTIKDKINRRRMLKEKEIEDVVTSMYNATKEIPKKFVPPMADEDYHETGND